MNARSISAKGRFDELQCILRIMTHTVHVVLLTETWFKNEEHALKYQIPSYTHHYNIRTDKTGGGVSAFIHNDLKHCVIESLYSGGNNYLWIKLEKLALEIGLVYYPGDTNINDFLDALDIQLQSRKRGLLFGDFNINLLKEKTVEKENRTKKKRKPYLDTLKESGYKILNKIKTQYCTRETTTKQSIIDHISSNLKNNTYNFTIIESPLTDHKQIHFELKRYKPLPKQRVVYKGLNYDKLYKFMENTIIDRDKISFAQLETKIKESINQSKDTKIKTLNLPQDDWIQSSILQEINARNVLWTNLKKDPKNKILQEAYNTKNDSVAAEIKNKKAEYYYNEFRKCDGKPKKTWKLINHLAKNEIKQNCAPPKLSIKNKTIVEPLEICNTFNEYFSTIGSLLANEIISKNLHQNQTNIHTQSTTNINGLTTLTPCTVEEISEIIDSLDSNTSTGIDGISTKALKCLKPLIVDKLTACLNDLLIIGYFPESMKTAKVTPIHKSGSKADPGNYRPISVLPVLSKILEKVLYKRLIEHLDSHEIISDRQFGFRPKSNTLAATVDLVTKIKSNIDGKNIVLGVFIDFKKAFDTVSHEILLKKLQRIGITGIALKMFESYLRDRSQIVKINEYESTPLPVTYGIPQGSILGPLLFLVYINDVQDLGLQGHLTLYADDTCLFYFGPKITEIIPRVQQDLDVLFSWLQTNLLTINISKTSYIIFKAKNKQIPLYNKLTINNIPLNEKSNEKYLGLRIDNQLTWQFQIDYLKKKLSALMASLRGVVRCFPRKLRLSIYNAMVKSHLIYQIEIWGSASKTRLAKLQIAQNKIIKLLFHYPYLSSCTKVYKETKLMTLQQLYKYHTCILVRKVLNKTIHTSITLTQTKHVTKRLTRRASYLVLPKVRTKYGKRMFTFEGAQIFNKLPSDIKSVKSLGAFKSKLAQHILNL